MSVATTPGCAEPPPPLYWSVMLEVERRRLELGIGMERLSEIAGIADRAYSKALYPDTESGRLARWQTVQIIMDALFPDGYRVSIEAQSGPQLDALRTRYCIGAARATYDRKAQREHMARIGQLGGRARAARLSPRRRETIARKAAKARWRRWRQRRAQGA